MHLTFKNSVPTSQKTLPLYYKCQPAHAIQGDYFSTLLESYKMHKFTLWVKLTGFSMLKVDGMYSDHCVLKG